jgi:integrase
MGLYKPLIVEYRLADGSYRTPDGKRVTKKTPGVKKTKRRSEKWYGRFTVAGKEFRLPLSTSKETAGRMLTAEKNKAELASVGYADPFEEHKATPLSGHLEDYGRYLAAEGNSRAYCSKTVASIQAILEGCRFKDVGDLQASAVVECLARFRRDRPIDFKPAKDWYPVAEVCTILNASRDAVQNLARLGYLPGPGVRVLPGKERDFHRETVEALLARRTRGIGISTSNDRLSAIKRFSKWLVKDRRTGADPLAHLDPLNDDTDRRHERRTLSIEDFERFLAAVAVGETFRALTGADRVIIYLLAIYTGLRASELASLTPASFDFDATPPTVTVQAVHSKRRRRDVQPLRPDLAATVRTYLAGRPRLERLWRGSWVKDGAAMLRADLAPLGIPYEDEAGRVLDFHGLRHTFISILARSGVHPKVAQILARHSTISLTMDRYTHLELVDVARGLETLPPIRSASSKPRPAGATTTQKRGKSGRGRQGAGKARTA